MDTRSKLANSGRCAYCYGVADTNDHSPPRCFLKAPLPSNLITLPACQKCNNSFSFPENVVRSVIGFVGTREDLVQERQPGGRLQRAFERDKRLRNIIEQYLGDDGKLELGPELLECFDRVLRKIVQGLYFALYQEFVGKERLKVLDIADRRTLTPDELAEKHRPSPLRNISNEPLPEISPNGWVAKNSVFVMKLQPLDGGAPIQQAFHLTRECRVGWVSFQPGVFTFAFVRDQDGDAVCVLDLWETIVAAVAAPWPHDRGPMRRGKKNPLSRDK